MTHLIASKTCAFPFRMGKNHVVDSVKGVNFDMPANSTVALVGESGSGKKRERHEHRAPAARGTPSSTLTVASCSTAQPAAGARGVPARHARRRHSVVFQEPMSSLNPVFTVGEQIAEVLRIHMNLNRPPGAGPGLELMTKWAFPTPRNASRLTRTNCPAGSSNA